MSHGHVLYARLDNDGDVLLQGPAIRATAAHADRVTLLCGPRGERAARLLPGVTTVRVHRADWIDPDPSPVDRATTDALVDEMQALGLDAAIVSTSFHQSPLPLALLLRLAGVPFIAAICEDYPGSLLDVRRRDPGDVHEVERALSLTTAAGFPLPEDDDGRLAVKRTHRAPEGLPPDYVVVHPGASVPARAWPPNHHRALVELLVQAGRDVVVTGAPAERTLTRYVAGAADPRREVTDLGGATTLEELAEVLANASAVVVGNTGPAHLAAAVGTPIVSLFAATVPSTRWRPYSAALELLHADVPCAGCRARECPVPGHPCLGAVTPADVLGAVRRLSLVAA